MLRISRLLFTLLSITSAWAWMASDSTAQSGPPRDWQASTEERLKSIYERGEFRPRLWDAKWSRDSLSYQVVDRGADGKGNRSVVYDVQSGQTKPSDVAFEGMDRNPLLSPDGSRILQFQNRSVVCREVASGETIKLLGEVEGRDISYRNLSWSPDGKRILFVESDATEVRLRPVLVPVDPSYPAVENRRFARVGEVIDGLRVGVVDSDGRNRLWLPIESPAEGFYLGQVEWAGNPDEVLVETFSRFRNARDILLVTLPGEVKRIFHEVSETWVESSQGKNSGISWIRGGQAFVMVSEKDGWRHAFLVSREGKELATLTPGQYDIIDRGPIDEANGWFYFYASPENGTQKFLYRVPLDGTGKLERITPEDQPGTHRYDFSPDAKWAFHTVSRLDVPPRVELVDLPRHQVVRVLEDNRQLHEKIQAMLVHPTEFHKVAIDGGIEMDAWIIKPRDFDPTRKYPVLVYVYGEPHAQTVLDEWGAVHVDYHRVVADLGFVVVSMDNRGTPAPKGAGWRRAVFGSLGPLSTEEQEAGLKALGRKCQYMDLERVGIWGWSGGGSNTLNAMFRKPDSYQVGIAVVPKPQPHLYNAWFQEMFMQTRERNPDGYQRAAAIHFAEGLKGKLLIITGSGETNTHIQIVEGLVDRLIELGKPFDYMVYPNRDHGLREGVGTSVHLRMLMIRYLIDNLSPDVRR